MSVNATDRNREEIREIQAIAESGADRPVLMLNLNRYKPEVNYPLGESYRSYMAVLEELLPKVGGRILWRTPVLGQPVGEQALDEILAAWYPSHQAFLDLPRAPGADENFRLRRECVEHAVIHRCDDFSQR